MHLQSKALRFSRPLRGSRPLFTKASTDAISGLFVWQLLASGRTYRLLSLSDGEFLIACITFRASEADQAMSDLHDQCRALDLVQDEVVIDRAAPMIGSDTC